MQGSKKHIGVIVTAMVLIFFIAGCVSQGGDRGRVKAQHRKGEQITIQQLTDDFAKYNVYYAGQKPADAVSVLFCPKGKDVKITPDRWWNAVADKKSLSSVISWMQTRDNIQIPTVQLIMGPNSQVFGYVYTYNINTKVRVVSDTEITVFAPVN